MRNLQTIEEVYFEPTWGWKLLLQNRCYITTIPRFEYLGGIETTSCLTFAENPYRFWAYLWGIETKKSSKLSFNSPKGFEPTYEELKRKMGKFDVLWIFFMVLSPPIGGMKRVNCSLTLFLDSGFEPTYEELKRWSIMVLLFFEKCSFWAYLWGIETTFYLKWLSETYVGFEPTYEELKHQFDLIVNWYKIQVSVLSLPMRNWNINLITMVSKLQHRCFEPTYEELKLLFSIFRTIIFLSFEPTYEELKPLSMGV